MRILFIGLLVTTASFQALASEKLAMSNDDCVSRLGGIRMQRLMETHADGTYGTDAATRYWNPSYEAERRYIRMCIQFGFGTTNDAKTRQIEMATLTEMTGQG